MGGLILLGTALDSAKVIHSNNIFIYWKEQDKIFRGVKKNNGGKTGRTTNTIKIHKHTIKEIKSYCGHATNQKTIEAMIKLGVPIIKSSRKKRKVVNNEW